MVPHSGQNLLPGVTLDPQAGQFSRTFKGAPHSGQNLALEAKGASQLGHDALIFSRQYSVASFCLLPPWPHEPILPLPICWPGQQPFPHPSPAHMPCTILFGIPAARPAHPAHTARALDKIRLQFLNGCSKSIVMGFFPGCRTDSLAYISGSAKDHQKGRRRHPKPRLHTGNRGLEPGPISTAAAVTIKFKLKSFAGAEVTVVSYKFNLVRHTVPSHISNSGFSVANLWCSYYHFLNT